MFIDVKKAHLNGVVGPDEYAYIKLPGEDAKSGVCGKLRRWLYGMRPAASAWEADFTEKLTQFGLLKGVSVPTAFYDKIRNLRCVVHGDDFTFLGWEHDLKEVREHMEAHYELKVRGVMGGEPGDCHEITILGRRLVWKGSEMRYEADPKHVEMICTELGLEANSKGLEKPCVRDESINQPGSDEPLDPLMATRFRAMAARANFLALDRPDIQFGVKEVCRDMSAPTMASWGKLKRLARYLLEFPRLVWDYGRCDADDPAIRVFTDSDWAGCLRTRKSTSGGVVMFRGVAVKSWSSTQATVSLSSGEAEYIALIKAAVEGLGAQSLARELGLDAPLRIGLDSSAAKSIASRSGAGKMRHLETRRLWVQEAVKTGRFVLDKVRGDSNPANLLTKPLGHDQMVGELEMLKCMTIRRNDL
jgi:hypothetical protein